MVSIGIGQQLQARPELQQKLAPRMIQSMEILQMPLLDLQEKVELELHENPVLELDTAEPDGEDPDAAEPDEEAADEFDPDGVIEFDEDNQADFNRLEVRLFKGPEPGAAQLDEATYDVTEFNRQHTPTDKSADPLDEPKVAGVEVTPLARKLSDRYYEWMIVFDGLKGIPAGTKRPTVRVKALDAQGKASEAVR